MRPRRKQSPKTGHALTDPLAVLDHGSMQLSFCAHSIARFARQVNPELSKTESLRIGFVFALLVAKRAKQGP